MGLMHMAAQPHQPERLPKGVWRGLLQHAFSLVDEIALHGLPQPFWTFGGGTVLMLRYRHRFSKDVDIFVPDPQYLGFVSPRLSDVAESVTRDYVEGPGYVKLLRPEGEIDFVASPNLTNAPFELWHPGVKCCSPSSKPSTHWTTGPALTTPLRCLRSFSIRYNFSSCLRILHEGWRPIYI